MNRIYSDELKIQIADMYNQGHKVEKLCEEHGASKTTIYSWIKDYQRFNMGNGTIVTAKDHYNLQKEYRRLETDYRILRECNCLVNAELSEKLNSISALDGKYTIHALCRVLGVRRSTYYHHKLRRPKKTEIKKQDEILKPVIKEIFDETKGRIDAKKIRYLIQRREIPISAKRVRRLMDEMDLVCRSMRKGVKYNYSKSSRNCVNLIERNFDQDEPNKVWVSDITYVRVNRKAYYLCIFIDLFSRKVVGYKVNDNQEYTLVLDALNIALESRKPLGGLILHSDQGAQYRTNEFITVLKDSGFKSSFSKAGCPYDNAVAENFFRMFKQEEANHIYYKTADDLNASVDDISFFLIIKDHIKN